jgi:hypothetical protein
MSIRISGAEFNPSLRPMATAVEKAARWLSVARELLAAEPFSSEFRRLALKAIDRAEKTLVEALALHMSGDNRGRLM